MARRIVTAEDVLALPEGGRLLATDDMTVTSAARELARRRNITVVEGAEAAAAPADASEAAAAMPAAPTGPPGTIIVTAVGVNRPGVLSELTSAIDSAVRPALEHWLNTNRSVAEAIVARIILSARAREASRAAQAEVTRKTATSGRLNLPGKLSDCTGSGREDSELFIVEGDSAGGSAKQGRDRGKQAILPLRGKVMNTEGMTLAKVLENKELADLVTALGCGLGKNFDLSKLRYGRVIILADADSDGHHIATLLLTFIYRHLPQLITNGKVFLAQPPLYRIDIGKDTMWALDDAHKDAILKQNTKNGRGTPEITRFKGLGEMMPKVLWETTLNPRTRRLLRVEVTDHIVTDRIMNELMGKDASARFRFIMERADEAEELDV